MFELTHVIDSTSIEQQVQFVGTECPRVLVGLSCLTKEFPPCLCDLVESTSLDVTEDESGKPALVTLTMHTKLDGNSNAEAIIAAVELTGLVADMLVERGSVQATFNLRRPQNRELHDSMAAR